MKISWTKTGIVLGIAILSWALLAQGCAGWSYRKNLTEYRTVTNPEAKADIRIEFAPGHAPDAKFVADLLPRAIEKAAIWGSFREPVAIRILHDHDALENALGKHGYAWLRAWARYDEILLQSPRTWGGYQLRRRVGELLAHELTHIVMYQTVGTASDWYRKHLPLWFREGMASYSAKQEHIRLNREELRAYYLGDDFIGDPVEEGPRIVRTHAREVYSAGHWLFTDLVREHGHAAIRELLLRIREGDGFRKAWLKTFRSPMTAFVDSWRDTLIQSGTAGGDPQTPNDSLP